MHTPSFRQILPSTKSCVAYSFPPSSLEPIQLQALGSYSPVRAPSPFSRFNKRCLLTNETTTSPPGSRYIRERPAHCPELFVIRLPGLCRATLIRLFSVYPFVRSIHLSIYPLLPSNAIPPMRPKSSEQHTFIRSSASSSLPPFLASSRADRTERGSFKLARLPSREDSLNTCMSSSSETAESFATSGAYITITTALALVSSPLPFAS